MRVKVVKMIAAVIYLKLVTFIDKIERKGYFGEYIKCKSKRKKTDVVIPTLVSRWRVSGEGTFYFFFLAVLTVLFCLLVHTL